MIRLTELKPPLAESPIHKRRAADASSRKDLRIHGNKLTHAINDKVSSEAMVE